MILSYAILGHLLGDFVFQSGKLVKLKMKKPIGVFVHVLIHLICYLALLLPLILLGNYNIFFGIFAIVALHYLIDQAKINYDLVHDKDKVRPFLLDQLLHLLTIYLVAHFLENPQYDAVNQVHGGFYDLYLNTSIPNLISMVIIFTKCVEIYNFQREREKNKNAKLKEHRQAMLKRLLIFLFLYGSVIASLNFFSWR